MKLAAPLRGARGVLIPSADETLFLRACLDWTEQGERAWAEWQSRLDLRTELNLRGAPYKRLLSLLEFACERRGVGLDSAEGAVLRAARLREEMRSKKIREILVAVIALLQANQLNFRILRGVALSQTVYPDPWLRHNHDIDLWLPSADIERAVAAFLEAGFRQAPPPISPNEGSASVIHPSDLPISFHSRLFPVEPEGLTQELWTRTETVRFDDAKAATLVPEDALVQLLAHVPFSPSRGMRVWVCDAVLLLRAIPNADWDRVMDLTLRTRSTLVVATLLDYLRAELDALVPERVISALNNAAGRTGRAEYELLLTGLRTSGGGGYRTSWQRAVDWQERRIVLEWYLGSRLKR